MFLSVSCDTDLITNVTHAPNTTSILCAISMSEFISLSLLEHCRIEKVVLESAFFALT